MRGSRRAALVSLQRSVWERNQRRIRIASGSAGETLACERHYTRAISEFERPASIGEVHEALCGRPLVLVGNSQGAPDRGRRAFADLVEATLRAGTTPLVALQEPDSKSDEADPIARFAREGLIEVRDLPLSGTNVGAAAKSLRALSAQRGERPVLALVDEFQLAPDQLPGKLGNRTGVLHQNAPGLYWRLVEQGLEHRVDAVRLGPAHYCLINVSPLAAQQSLLAATDEEAWEGLTRGELTERFAAHARRIGAFFGLPTASFIDHVAIFGPADLEIIEQALRSGLFGRRALLEIRRNLLNGESYFIPDLPAVYFGRPTRAAVAEEAAHFVRHASTGSPPARTRPDLFYQTALNEAAGYLGSKVVAPDRETPGWVEILELGLVRPQFGMNGTERAAFSLAARHLRAETDPDHAGDLPGIYRAQPAGFVGAAHLLGYALGERLWQGLARGTFSAEYVRRLFTEDWSEPGSALTRYLLLRADLGNL